MESIGTLEKKLERVLWEAVKNDPSIIEKTVDEIYELPSVKKYSSQIEHYRGKDGAKEVFESVAQKTIDTMHSCGMLQASVLAKR